MLDEDKTLKRKGKKGRHIKFDGSATPPPRLPKEPSKRSSRKRAIRNWHRARAAAQRKVTKDMLGPQRRYTAQDTVKHQWAILLILLKLHGQNCKVMLR